MWFPLSPNPPRQLVNSRKSTRLPEIEMDPYFGGKYGCENPTVDQSRLSDQGLEKKQKLPCWGHFKILWLECMLPVRYLTVWILWTCSVVLFHYEGYISRTRCPSQPQQPQPLWSPGAVDEESKYVTLYYRIPVGSWSGLPPYAQRAAFGHVTGRHSHLRSV